GLARGWRAEVGGYERLEAQFGGSRDCVELPLSGDTLERVLAAIVQPDPGAGDEILDGSGDENLARLRDRRDSRPDVDRNTADLAVHQLALPCVKPCPDLEAERANAVPNRTRAPNRPRGSVKDREESITGRVHLPSAEVPQLRSDEPMVFLHKLAPSTIAELGSTGGGIDEIGEQDRGQHAVRDAVLSRAFG